MIHHWKLRFSVAVLHCQRVCCIIIMLNSCKDLTGYHMKSPDLLLGTPNLSPHHQLWTSKWSKGPNLVVQSGKETLLHFLVGHTTPKPTLPPSPSPPRRKIASVWVWAGWRHPGRPPGESDPSPASFWRNPSSWPSPGDPSKKRSERFWGVPPKWPLLMGKIWENDDTMINQWISG